MQKPLTFVSVLMLLLCGLISNAQDKSNKGKEFWLGYGYHWTFDAEGPPFNTQELVLYLSTEAPATVTVSVTNTTWSQTVNIPANTVNASIFIPKTGPDDARIFNEGLQNKSVHIVSDTDIVVYAHSYNTMTSAATMLMPVETYGYKYFSLNYSQYTSGFSPPTSTASTTQNGPAWYSWFYVVASEDYTRLQITPADTTRNGWLKTQTYTVNLMKGEIYTVMGKLGSGNQLWEASKDLTGSKVVSVPGADGSCHPVAMFSGSSGIRLCRMDGGEVMQQQVFPTQAWGTRYLTYHMLNNTSTDINAPFKNFYRVAVDDPTTVVKRNGMVLTGLINNFYYEFLDSTGGDYIESDKPVLVAQYTPGGNRCWAASQTAYGDPEMFYLSPLEQGRKDVLFYATRKSTIDYNYVHVIVPTAGLNSLKLDGVAFDPLNTRLHPNHPGYTVAVARIPGAAAQHRLTCDSIFTGTMYGIGYFESYGYNVGTFINNLNYYSELKNTYSSTTTDSFTCPKTPVRIFVKVGYPATRIHWKLSQVPGLTPSADSIIVNPVPVRTEQLNGRNYYVYTLQQDFSFATAGTYYIPVSYSATVIENCNQTENAMVKVVVKPGPKADFSFPSPSCLINTIPFTGTSVPGIFNITSYTWFFHDNTTANTVNASKLYPAPGNYDVRYRILSDNGCAGDTTKTVTILENPTAAFSISGNICTKDSVRITDASTVPVGTISSWYWNFGDGNTSTHTNNTAFYHQYTTAGNYTIYLITTSSNGCKSDTTFIPVTVLPRPTANFTAGGNICLGDSIHFVDASIPAAGGTLTSWQWNFGDNSNVTYNNGAPFYHRYTSTGNFNVTLVVTGTNTCASDTFRLTVNVSSKPPSSFTVSGKPCIDSLFSFTSSVPTGGTNPPTWYWNFGDNQAGNSASSNMITHAYTNTATNLVVKHWVSYAAGCASDTAFQTIPLVRANPVAAFSIIGDTLCEKKPITLTSTVTGTHTWNWTLGPTVSNNTPPFTHNFNTAGTYSIRLFLSNPEGCNSVTVSQPITINPVPAINAGPDKMINAGTSTSIDATITNPGNYSFLWTPSIYLDASTILNPVSTPDNATTYTIQAVDKISKCMGTDQVVISPITGLFIPSAFTPNGDSKNDKWDIPGLALYPDARVTIFNRAGQVIFDGKNYSSNPWDGTSKNTKQPGAVYVYMIRLNDPANRLLKGTVTIIR
jgi:gliding motility-associated-like protein